MTASLHPATVPGSVIRFRSTSRSHVGRVRAINEDRVFDGGDHAIWAVADGMGGHRGGDLAAQTVIDALRRFVADGEPDATQLTAALAAANDTIVERNRHLGLDAGATVVAAMIAGDAISIAWAGDSRAYLIAGGEMRQLTRDHSVVQDLVDAGLIDAARAASHPQANVVTRALGVNADAQLELTSVALPLPFRLLLCSDGLSRSLLPGDFDAALPLDVQADHLLADALARDGSDNISFVLVESISP